jgi:imidazolonepropionase-like amidohydrolase
MFFKCLGQLGVLCHRAFSIILLVLAPAQKLEKTMRRYCSVLILIATMFLAMPTIAADVALIHGRIYTSPDAKPIDDGTLLIHDGLIQRIGPAGAVNVPRRAKVTDLQGAVVTAGFWNSHVHFLPPPFLNAEKHSNAEIAPVIAQMLTRWGFTTVFDVASSLANTLTIRRRIEAGEIAGPAILTVGDPFFPKNGTPIYVKKFLQDNGFPNEEITDLAAAVARVHRQIHEGADGVKLFAGAIVGGEVGVLPMPLDQARELVAAAHADGKPVFAHPTNLDGLNVAIESGVDILAHTTPDGGPWSAELTSRILAHHMALIPTLTLFQIELKKSAHPENEELRRFIDTAVGQVAAYSKAGGQILFGTDVGYIDVFDTTEEYRQMGRALDWRQILTSLTVAPATRFGFAKTKGRLARGMEADLVVLRADPAKDLTAFAKVRMTIRHGRTLYDAGS